MFVWLIIMYGNAVGRWLCAGQQLGLIIFVYVRPVICVSRYAFFAFFANAPDDMFSCTGS